MKLELSWWEFLLGLSLLLAPSPIGAILSRQGKGVKMENKDFGEWLDLVVEVAADYKAAKADGRLSAGDALLFVPALMKIPRAIEGSSVAFKDLSVDDLKAAAIAILDAAGDNDGKHAVYVSEGFSILGHGVEIVESVKKIVAA